MIDPKLLEKILAVIDSEPEYPMKNPDEKVVLDSVFMKVILNGPEGLLLAIRMACIETKECIHKRMVEELNKE